MCSRAPLSFHSHNHGKLGAQAQLVDLSAKQQDGVAALLAVGKKPMDQQQTDIKRNWTAKHDDNNDNDDENRRNACVLIHGSVFDFDFN